MQIVILGAGTVGTSIADLLCRSGHSITVVDSDQQVASLINQDYDVKAIHGSAAQSSVLFQAGVMSADICIAVTGSDEVNIVAASMAKGMGTRRTIARIYAPVFRDLSTFDYQRHFGIDRMLSLEQLSAMEFARSIRTPDSVVVENFARGELEVQEVRIAKKSKYLGVPLKQLALPSGVRIGSIGRGSDVWIPGADDEIQKGDRLTLFGNREDVENASSIFQPDKPPTKSVVIVGGGETGLHLARALEVDRFRVTLMDTSKERCDYLAKLLNHTTILQADGTRRDVLEEEGVGTADIFIGCTGEDENNIMACVEASDIGAKRVMSVVGRPDYARVVGKLGIDLAVSERNVMAKQILAFLNQGVVVSRTPLPRGDIDVLEIEVHAGTPATQTVLSGLQLPKQCLIAAVMEEDFVQVPSAQTQLHAGQKVVALMARKEVENALKLFEVPSS